MGTLRFKILALAALLVAGTVIGTVAPVLYSANREVADRLETTLAARADMFGQLMQTRAEQLLNTVELLTLDREFQQIISGDDRQQIETALGARARRAGAAVGVLMDLEGNILATSDGDSLGRVALPGLVSEARDNGRGRAVLKVADTATYEMVTVPLRAPLPLGWLSMGFVIDDVLAQRMHALTGLDVTLLHAGDGLPSLLATSMTDVDTRELAQRISAASRRYDGSLRFRAGGLDYLSVQRNFIPGSPDVAVVLKQSVQASMAPFRRLQTQALTVGGLALLLALAGAVLLARTIGEPLQLLLAAARRIREGNYTEGVRIHSSEEFAELAVAFNAMQEGIAEREERITYQAQFDALTGLPNRIQALEKLADAIDRADAQGYSVSLLVVDLNSFNEIGSSLGHDIGDALLAQAAERLRASLDARHVLARLEGDQFLVIMETADVDAAQETAEDLLRLLSAGLSVRDVNIGLDARIGICAFPDHGLDPDKLLMRASVAKNDAKEVMESIHVYQDGRENRHVRQLAVLGDLRRAVRQDELKLFLQPKLDLASGRVCGAEALVRWDHPTLGFLPPNDFIPVAEQSGNISLITHWALTAAIRECRLWQEEGLDLSISVNLSGRDLHNKMLPYFILELLRDHDLDARRLVLEVTEQALVRDLNHASIVLECLRDLGAFIAIDDFGTGYSSLSHIRNLPVDELKIDRSFVMELPGNRADVAIVRAAIELAHSLGMDTLAEGVENGATLRWLQAHGCERAQGFHISKPMPAEQFTDWVRAWEPSALPEDFGTAAFETGLLRAGHGQA